MTFFYSFHSLMESQALKPAWSISKSKRAEFRGGEINHLTEYNVRFGGNSLSLPEPIGSNPIGVC